MTDKFELYDILGIVVPGVLLCYVFLLCFPGLLTLTPRMGDALNTIAFSAVAVFVGQLVQALASLLEPCLFKTWKGKSSTLALTTGLGEQYWSAAEAARVRTKLKAVLGADATVDTLFRGAIQRTEKINSVRVAKFNALYAYHRALLVLLLLTLFLLGTSFFIGALRFVPKLHVLGLCAPVTAALLLIWHRTRQRSFYYVREVLQVAEGLLDSPTPAPK